MAPSSSQRLPQSEAGSQAGPPPLGRKSRASHRHSAPASGLAAPHPRLIPSVPFAQGKNSRSRWGEHTPSFTGREYLQRQVEEKGSRGVGGDCGYKADNRLQNGPCTHPNPRTGGRASRGPGRRAGEGQQGAEPLGWGAQGLVNIDHSQKGMGVGEGSPYTSSQG